MIEIRIGYDTIYNSIGEINPYGSAQWCTLYLTDDFKSFYDTDGEKYYKNKLAPVIYDKTVQKLREEFLNHFNDLNTINDLENLNGVLYINELTPNLNY